MRNNEADDGGQDGRILAIDYGSVRVGLAISDPLGIIAQGAGVLKNNNDLLGQLAEMVAERNISLILVGMPYRSDGSKSKKALEIDIFSAELKRVVTIPIKTQDESFTSVEAGRIHINAGMKKKQRREKGRVE